MPIIVAAPTGSSTTPVVSADRVVTAVPNAAFGGVLLRAVYAGQPPHSVTFWRTGPDGTAVVRSGDPAVVVAGEAHAYDHEARPGVPYGYAVDVSGVRSQSAVLAVGNTSGRSWVKSATDPGASLQVRTVDIKTPRASQTGLTQVYGSSAAHATIGVREGAEADLLLRTDTDVEAVRMRRTLEQGLLLWQPREGLGPDMWLAVQSDSEVRRYLDPLEPGRDWQVRAVQTRRPPTSGARLLMPGWGWSEATAPFATVAELKAAYPSMWALLLAGVG